MAIAYTVLGLVIGLQVGSVLGIVLGSLASGRLPDNAVRRLLAVGARVALY